MTAEFPDPLRDFIASQAGRFTTNGVNHFSQGFRRLLRYQRFLALILERHLPVADALCERMENVTELVVGTPPPWMEAEFDERQRLCELAHLDIESFYLFSKIFLDWVARAIEFYFGRARSLALDSHDDLAKRVQEYAGAKGLSAVPEPLMKSILQLKKEIAEYRDYQIAHHKNFRTVQGTSVGPSGPVMGIGYTGGLKPGQDSLEIYTLPLVELTKAIIEYVGHVTTYLRANQEKAVFERRSEGQQES